MYKVITRLYFLLLATSAVQPDITPNIIGGEPAKLGEYPGIVSLAITSADGSVYKACSGTLIRKSNILTAAHCVYEVENPEEQVNIHIYIANI